MKYDVIIAAAIIAVGILLSTNYHAEHNRFMFVAKNGDGPPMGFKLDKLTGKIWFCSPGNHCKELVVISN